MYLRHRCSSLIKDAAPGISSKEDVLIERPPESRLHFGIRPMRQVQELESTRETFSEPLRDQHGRRSQQHYSQCDLRTRVFIPQAFYRLRPSRNLLNFVENQNRSGFARVDEASRLCSLAIAARSNRHRAALARPRWRNVLQALTFDHLLNQNRFPTCLGPVTAWIKRRASRRRRASIAA